MENSIFFQKLSKESDLIENGFFYLKVWEFLIFKGYFYLDISRKDIINICFRIR